MSGDATDQAMRLALETGEALFRLTVGGVDTTFKVLGITGKTGYKLAAFLLAAMGRGEIKEQGQTNLKNLLKTEPGRKIFMLKEGDEKIFKQGAKDYNLVYSILKPKGTKGIIEVIVPESQTDFANRIIENNNLITLNAENVEITNKEEKSVPEVKENDIEKKPEKAKTKDQSEPTLEDKKKSTKDTPRESVRTKLKEMEEKALNKGRTLNKNKIKNISKGKGR